MRELICSACNGDCRVKSLYWTVGYVCLDRVSDWEHICLQILHRHEFWKICMSYVQFHLHHPLIMKVATNGVSHPRETVECPVGSLGVPPFAKVRIYVDYHHASTQHLFLSTGFSYIPSREKSRQYKSSSCSLCSSSPLHTTFTHRQSNPFSSFNHIQVSGS